MEIVEDDSGDNNAVSAICLEFGAKAGTIKCGQIRLRNFKRIVLLHFKSAEHAKSAKLQALKIENARRHICGADYDEDSHANGERRLILHAFRGQGL